MTVLTDVLRNVQVGRVLRPHKRREMPPCAPDRLGPDNRSLLLFSEFWFL
jgi:hypothetical protein